MSDTYNGDGSFAGPGNGGDMDVARWLQIAGPRLEAPERDAAIVKWAARAEWRRQVRAQSRRKWTWRAGGLLAAAALAGVVLNPGIFKRVEPAAQDPVVVVAAVETRTGLELPASEGGLLRTGDVVETGAGGVPARVALRMLSGASVRLDTNSRLKLVSATKLELERGAVYVDSGFAGASGELAIRTPRGIVQHVGTQYEVRLMEEAGTVRVRVREGVVELKGEGGTFTVQAESELTVPEVGDVKPAELPCYGDAWQWVQEILPELHTDGRPLGEFLNWAVREGCWELRFASEVAEAASGELVHGSIRGLSLKQAMELVVLLGSDLNYTLEDGVLTIDAPEDTT